MAVKILIDITDSHIKGDIEGNIIDVIASLGTYLAANPDVKELFKNTLKYVDEFEECLGINQQTSNTTNHN